RGKGGWWIVCADLALDTRQAIRSFLKTPAFVATTVLILALGIGVNTAIFSVLKAVVLQPLPYPEPDRLLTVWTPQVGYDFNPISTPNFLDYLAQNDSFEAWGGYTRGNVNLATEERPERISSIQCTAGVLEALAVQPALGRLFTADAQAVDGEKVVLLSDRIWRVQFDSNPDLIGQPITIDGIGHTVLGIMPGDFEFPSVFFRWDADLWFPLALVADENDRDSHWLWTIGRLKDGLSIDQAQAEFDSIATDLAEQYPEANSQRIARIVSLTTLVVGIFSDWIWILMGAVGLVLLIACANVASLLMARGVSRQTEVAVRMSIGAGRIHLIRQMLTESFALTTTGGVLGLLLAWWGVGLLRGVIPAGIPRIETVQIDGWVLLFSLAITLITGLVFGLVPAFSVSGVDLTSFLHQGGRPDRALGKRKNSFLSALVMVQFALALVLANGAFLMWKSLEEVVGSPELYEPQRVLMAGISLQGPTYEKIEQRNLLWADLLERVQSLPGVEHASACSQLPFKYGSSGSILAEGEEFDPEIDRSLTAFTWATGDYFQAIGTTLLSGRKLEPQDADSAKMRLVVNRTLAERYWPGESAIGKRLRSNTVPQWFEGTVVGVVDNFRQWSLESKVYPEIFFPFDLHTRNERWLTIRTSGDPMSQIAAIRQELAALDSSVPLSDIQTGDQLYDLSSSSRRFSTLLFGLFALLSLILVATGIYGVMSFFVTQRTHEIGVRVALGAEVKTVLKLVIERSLRLSLAGIGLGVIITVLTSRVIESMLYQVSPLDIVSGLLTILFLLLVGLLASVIPAIRAASVDPIRALQAD
ncbi:MAG: ABC transporter permease, partial [bacterium]|nr:ABC transporter permease [bacterium]